MIKEQKLSLLFICVLRCAMAMSRCMIFMSGCVAILMRVRLLFFIHWFVGYLLMNGIATFTSIMWIFVICNCWTYSVNNFHIYVKYFWFRFVTIELKVKLTMMRYFFYGFDGKKNVQSNTGWTFFFMKKFIIQWNLIVSLRTGRTPFTKIIIYDFSNEKKVCGSITQAYFKFNLNNMKSQ